MKPSEYEKVRNACIPYAIERIGLRPNIVRVPERLASAFFKSMDEVVAVAIPVWREMGKPHKLTAMMEEVRTRFGACASGTPA